MSVDPMWDDWVPASHIPPESFLFFGANPAHTPAAESQPPTACKKCGGAVVAPERVVLPSGRAVKPGQKVSTHVLAGDPDPIRAYEEVVVVCGGCARSRYDGTAAIHKAVIKTARTPLDEQYGATMADLGGRGVQFDPNAAPDAPSTPTTPTTPPIALPTPERPLTRRERRAALYARRDGSKDREVAR
jgi:hypothetical protein